MKLLRFFKSKEWMILWPFYVTSFLYGALTLVSAFYIIYFQNIGLSFSDIALISAVPAISVVIFEIPTGAIADHYGRKFSVVFGLVMLSGACIIVPLVDSVFLLILLFLFMGLAATFISGAYTAWVVDLLKREKQEALIQNFMVKDASFTAAGAVIGPLLGGVLVSFLPLGMLWIIQGFGMILTTLLLLKSSKEYFQKKDVHIKKALNKLLKNTGKAIRFSLTHRTLLLLFVASIFWTIVASLTTLAWQPLLINLKMPVNYLGYFYSFLALLGIFSPYLAHTLKKFIKKEKIIFALLSSLFIILMISFYFVNSPFFYLACSLITLISIISYVWAPIFSAYQQQFIPSKTRATIISFQNSIFALVSGIGVLISGMVMDKIGPKMTVVTFSVFAIPAIICYLLIKNGDKNA